MSKIDQLEAEVKDLREVLGALAERMDEAVKYLAERAVFEAMQKQNPPQEGKKVGAK